MPRKHPRTTHKDERERRARERAEEGAIAMAEYQAAAQAAVARIAVLRRKRLAKAAREAANTATQGR
jgi:hypothetical protein